MAVYFITFFERFSRRPTGLTDFGDIRTVEFKLTFDEATKGYKRISKSDWVIECNYAVG